MMDTADRLKRLLESYHTLAKKQKEQIERLQEENLKLRKQLWDNSWPTMRNEEHNPYTQKETE